MLNIKNESTTFGLHAHLDDSPATPGTGEFSNCNYRLDIKLNMGEPAYMHRSDLHDGLRIDSSSPENSRATLSPVAVAYSSSDFGTAYTTVVNYNNYSLAFDSSLPTPVSVGGSPSLGEKSPSKMAHSFSHNGTTPQQPTPPGTARPHGAEWFNQAPSPMAPSPMALHNSSTDMMDIQGLEGSHSPPMAVSGQEPNYWGSYGVSGPEPQEELSPQMTSHALFVNPRSVVPSNLLRNGNHNMVAIAPAPPQAPQRIPLPHEQHNFATLNQPPPPAVMFDIHPSYKTNRRTSKPRAHPTANKKRSRASGKAMSSQNNTGDEYGSSPNARQSPSAKVSDTPTLKLREDAPEYLKYLLLCRQQWHGAKGKNMWECIQKEMNKRFPDHKEKANLQMQLQRGIIMWADWSASEDQALLEAYAEVEREYEKNRWKDIRKLMEKHGGCREWNWKTPNITHRLHELSIEHIDTKGRKRKDRRNIMEQRRQQRQQRQSEVNLWPQNAAAGYPGGDNNMDLCDSRPQWTDAHTDEILEQYLEEVLSPDEDLDDDDEMASSSQHRPSVSSVASSEMDPTQATSERVARQACDQMLAQQALNNPNRYYSNQR